MNKDLIYIHATMNKLITRREYYSFEQSEVWYIGTIGTNFEWSNSFACATAFTASEADVELDRIAIAQRNLPLGATFISDLHFHTQRQVEEQAEIPNNIRELLKL